jgi:hypothetical protein
MYASYKAGLCEGTESFSTGWIAGENFVFLATWVTAGWLLWPVQFGGWPVATIGWALYVVGLQILLKKHFCSGCYYYGKSCHLGWGRLAARLFAQDTGNPKLGVVLAVPMYMLPLPLVLIGAVLIGVWMPVGTVHWVVLGSFIALHVLSLALRPKGCGQCKMRAVCPGSAAKPKAAG